VQNLLLIRRVFFSESAIEKRKPLGVRARRAGWVGCNILLREIPIDGKIAMVCEGRPVPADQVRREFERTRGLTKIPPSVRGWTLDVFNVVRRIRKERFNLNDLYQFENELQSHHPDNRNVRPKIRQQLQVLRDLGILKFTGRGEYILTA